MIANDAITVINAFYDCDTEQDVYQATVIKNAHWYGQNKVAVDSDGIKHAKIYKIRIPQDSVAADNRAYVSPITFGDLTDKTAAWTINPGDKIVRGEVAAGFDFDKLGESYDEVTTVMDWRNNLHARNAHIYVEGN